MELAKFTLADYIDYHNSKSSAVEIESLRSNSMLVGRECPSHQRMANMWAIATHIAQGLEFMHSHEHVHRDLKPSNSTDSIYFIADDSISPFLL
jgi:serine/threonine protein kinase